MYYNIVCLNNLSCFRCSSVKDYVLLNVLLKHTSGNNLSLGEHTVLLTNVTITDSTDIIPSTPFMMYGYVSKLLSNFIHDMKCERDKPKIAFIRQ